MGLAQTAVEEVVPRASMKLVIREEAEQDIEAAMTWCAEQRAGLEQEFQYARFPVEMAWFGPAHQGRCEQILLGAHPLFGDPRGCEG